MGVYLSSHLSADGDSIVHFTEPQPTQQEDVISGNIEEIETW